ncbi:MAG: hypothetical protein Q7U76_12655 [Nitrospirota bacterium]|nr:hypothetical protein [Nitrospirota bacterium]
MGMGAVEKWFTTHKPDQETVQLMLEKLAVLAQSEQWRKDGGSFIPAPMTWLNQKRWKDEIVTGVPQLTNRPSAPPPRTDPIARGQWKQVYGDPKKYGFD